MTEDPKTHLLPIPSLVTLTDCGDPRRPVRGGIVINRGANGRFHCLISTDGQSPHATPFAIVPNVAINDDTPLAPGERWRITAVTGTGDVVDMVNKFVSRIDTLEKAMATQQDTFNNALANISTTLRNAMKTMASGNAELEERLEKALAVGTVVNRPQQETRKTASAK
jgi:uncharacterized coiled-coil protein SlyX